MSKPNTRPRESALKEKWAGIADRIPVNETQHSFDTRERERAYIEAQFPKSDRELRARYDTYREEWYRRPKEFDPGPAPLAVICELVSTCNLGCSMCYTIEEAFQNKVVGTTRMLPWPVVRAVIDECAELDLSSILFSWRGESTLYRSRDEQGRVFTFPDVLKYARDKGIMEITSLTHGQNIGEEMAEAIVAAEPNWISFSVDGLGETYNKVRTPPSKAGKDYDAFGVVVENIKRLVRIRDEQGKTKPQIRCNTIYLAIADDPRGYRDFMAGIGVDWVTTNELLDFRGPSIPDEAIRPGWACQYPFQRLSVAANGSIVPCTGAHREEAALTLGIYKGSPPKRILDPKTGEFKNLDLPEQTLKSAWTSKKLEGIRKMHRQGRREKIDPGCRYCRHGAIKHGLEWLPDDWDMENMEWVEGATPIGRRVWRD